MLLAKVELFCVFFCSVPLEINLGFPLLVVDSLGSHLCLILTPYRYKIEFYGDFDRSFDKSLDLGTDLSTALLGHRSYHDCC
ncbi:hypothetical protein LOK49_LG07G00718 [Camellia lanceoleosa]|uniref:Uncharacterized protein n=1 Tax=Camellia lanceoleosa TaxID=1840588 RepID=A0ACC0GZ18_9ERIC|nr:hypothetical protein LOK49_LG07G00718 [Camellia lanceoleosa]